jgi:predicted DNA-binding antitoxin AbrB/MazE fold protein
MKNYIFKTLLTLALSTFTLPMLSQDYMNIYFKDGNFRKFYMKNITEISTSKVDKEGIQHSDYSSQCITTLYETLVYNLEDVDSITFTKIDEEKAKQNFVSAMPIVISSIEKCETIEEAESIIDEIKNAQGVADVWSDGHELYVALAEGETISFHFDHDNESSEILGAQTRASSIKLATVSDNITPPLKAVIANQQHKDENRDYYITDHYTPFQNALLACGISADYVASPNIDFFYNNCQDPDNADHLNIYDYDIIFLVTHGGYSELKYLGKDENGNDARISYNRMGHSFCTSEELLLFESANLPKTEADWVSYFQTLRDWRNNSVYKDATDLEISITFNHEKRNNKLVWVGHPKLTEFFFENTALGHFTNPNSLFFNTACQSLKGDNNTPSFSFAEKFFGLGLGAYLGFSQSDCTGKKSGPKMLTSMLNGWSLEKAYHSLPNYMLIETIENFKEAGEPYNENDIHGAELLYRFNENNENMSPEIFLLPIYTDQVTSTDLKQESSGVYSATLTAQTTQYRAALANLTYGFTIEGNNEMNDINAVYVPQHVPASPYRSVFQGTVSDLKPGHTYKYRAYTYDGENYNYGNECFFKLDKLPDLKISTTSLVLALGHTGIIKISGSGDFDAISSDPKTVTVSINNLKDGNADLHIQTHKTGPATITVTDKKTGQTKKIEVTVYPKLQVPAQKLELEEGEKVSFTIAAGSGEYTAKSDKENYATASTKGNEVFIEAISEGDAVVTITDTKTKLTADVAVKVIKKAAIADITLSTKKLNLNVGETGQIKITSGSGEYGVTNLNSDKAKATLQGTTITIEALAVGEAKVVVTDIKTGQKIIIEITVTQKTTYADIALSTQEIHLNVGEIGQIEITSGSGNYTTWIYDTKVAELSLNGNIVTVKALALGRSVARITDNTTNKFVDFGIVVEEPSAYDKYAVDLGLSVKWAKMNVGAVSIEDCGEHYAWGETESKSYFSWSSYDYCNGNKSTITKYNSHDGKTILEPSDDAATVVMGRNWRTPTLTEMQELVNRCKWTQETLNGVKGMRVTGPNGNSIFLPFGGQMSEDVLHHSDTTGYYYVSNLSSDGEKYAPALVCYGNKQEFVPHARFFGLSIRPVFNKK